MLEQFDAVDPKKDRKRIVRRALALRTNYRPEGIMCDACDTFDVEVEIHGPQQLQRIVAKIQAAVDAGILRCNEFESSRALIGQPAFSDLDLDNTIPDIIRYYFECSSCRSVFGLLVEAFHGQGGTWSRL